MNAPLPTLSPAPIAPRTPPYDTAPYQRDELLHEVFAATASSFPQNVAVRLATLDPESSRRSELTYAGLRCRAAQFARYLISRGVRRGDRVVICLPRGLDAYMSLLGVLEAGAAYVPVDWSTPQDRVDYIAAESEAFAVITTAERAPDFPATLPNVIAVDAAIGDVAAFSTDALTRADTGAEPEDAAYLIYTSGSTGRPKGVVIRNRNACFQIRSEASILGVTSSDRVYAGASLAFDISVEEMWAAFLNGAELLVGSEALAKAGPDLAATLEEQGVTVWCPVPSLLAVLDRDVATARIVNVGGEACPPELVRRWARPGRRMLNTYGPTETTVTATWTELLPGRPVTIGTPLPEFTAWIVDEALLPIPAGAEGELVIGGPALALGYLHREELTAEKFVIAPFAGPDGAPHRIYRTGDLTRLTADGEIDFLGRIDTQVKIRGYRVELGEIEAAIADDLAVAQSVVNLYLEEDGSELLVAFLTPRSGLEIDLDRIRTALAGRLPAYMRPNAYEVRRSLPTLISGKVNRKALERPRRVEVETRTLEPPATQTEADLLAAWREALGQQAISVEDDFFEELGGHSLRAARMVSIARATPALASVSIQDLYAAPTIRSAGGPPGRRAPRRHRRGQAARALPPDPAGAAHPLRHRPDHRAHPDLRHRRRAVDLPLPGLRGPGLGHRPHPAAAGGGGGVRGHAAARPAAVHRREVGGDRAVQGRRPPAVGRLLFPLVVRAAVPGHRAGAVPGRHADHAGLLPPAGLPHRAWRLRGPERHRRCGPGQHWRGRGGQRGRGAGHRVGRARPAAHRAGGRGRSRLPRHHGRGRPQRQPGRRRGAGGPLRPSRRRAHPAR